MSAFLKIPMQFLILFVGILVFIFYLFSKPPMIFNAVDAGRAAQIQPVEHERLETEFAQAHQARRSAAMALIDAQNQDSEDQAKTQYLLADSAYQVTRQEATEFVRRTNADSSFNDVNYVFPVFIINNMPIGLVGLMVAAILAAAMSSVAAELNSLATASTMDFYRRFGKPGASEKNLLRFGRIATLVWGIFACIVATFATNLGSLIEVVNTFGSFFYGSLLGVFVLAFAVPKVQATGAFYGLLFGIASVWIASAFTDIAFLWFNVVGCLITVAAGYVISVFGLGVNDVQ